MNRAFLELYNRELQLLYERARDFADAYPGVAERLGGLDTDTMDPGLVGVLEGAAFMAARVQLKLKSEFSVFTEALLDQLAPSYLAPIPSAVIVRAAPPFEDPALAEGRRYPRGSILDAVYVERDRRVSCRFRLSGDLEVWPFHLEQAAYLGAVAPLHALGLDVGSDVSAGLRLSFRRLSATPGKERPATQKSEPAAGDVRIDTLPIQLVGPAGDAAQLYEQIFATLKRVSVRSVDPYGEVRVVHLAPDAIEQVGFGADEALIPRDDRMFSGFELLRDFFAFPARWLGFRVKGLRRALAGIRGAAFDLVFEFGTAVPRLASIVDPRMFALYAAPAVNLFEMNCSRILLRRSAHEHRLVPDASRTSDFEPYRILDVQAHYPGRKDKVPVYPLYSLPADTIRASEALYYTYRRLPHRPSTEERRRGGSTRGTDIFLSLAEPATIDSEARARELSVRALVSNGAIAEQLPVGEAGADFYLIDDTAMPLHCVAGPTPSRDSLVAMERRQKDTAPFGSIGWKLLNLLQVNHLGLVDRSDRDRAGGLREVLALFSDLSDLATEQRLRGIEGISSRPIVRRLKQANGFNAARGIEITVRFDERAFEGVGIFLLGAVLDRFFADYAPLNSFSETVIETRQRGVVKRWPPRAGTGQPL